jgi:hypothetical protein
MSTEFSAGPHALGYYYQVRYALYLILNSREETKLSVEIETLDDIVIKNKDKLSELIQTKHHVAKNVSLTDSSKELWKTIRIWSTYLQEKKISPSDVILTLITTAKASDNSIAVLLCPDNHRDPEIACQKLVEVAKTSENKYLQKCFEVFMDLEEQQRKMLVESIQILILSPNISDTPKEIKRFLSAVRREYRDRVYEQLEGWWFDKVISHLNSNSQELITKFEVENKIAEINEQYGPDVLPDNYSNAKIPDSHNPKLEKRRFVMQLKIINLPQVRIKMAKSDYYKAYKQRAEWLKKHLLFVDESNKYENKLAREWQEYFYGREDEDISIDEASEQELKKIGRQIYNQIMKEVDIPIRPKFKEKYMMRGSYHILADKKPPEIGWHPKFEELLSKKN